MYTVGLDFNPYCRRGVVLDSHDQVVSHFDSRSARSARLWLRRTLQSFPDCAIAASPLDDLPEEIRSELASLGLQPDWINPTLMRLLFTSGRSWQLARKLHRARLVAYLSRCQTQPAELHRHIRDFEHHVAREALSFE